MRILDCLRNSGPGNVPSEAECGGWASPDDAEDGTLSSPFAAGAAGRGRVGGPARGAPKPWRPDPALTPQSLRPHPGRMCWEEESRASTHPVCSCLDIGGGLRRRTSGGSREDRDQVGEEPRRPRPGELKGRMAAPRPDVVRRVGRPQGVLTALVRTSILAPLFRRKSLHLGCLGDRLAGEVRS